MVIGDDISTASSDHDSIISDIYFPDTTITPATPSILSQRSRKHSVQRSGQRSDPRACDSCESLQRILIKKDNELAEYVNRLKMLNRRSLRKVKFESSYFVSLISRINRQQIYHLDKLIAKLQSQSLAAEKIFNHKMFAIQLCSFEPINDDGITIDGNIVEFVGTFHIPN